MSNPALLSFTDALHSIKNQSKCLVANEYIDISHALHRILAANVVAPINVPPAANSAMDGYALKLDDWHANKIFVVSQRIAAGAIAAPLESNTCARIFTGAEVPQGADVVIMQENATVHEQGVSFSQTPILNDNIRPLGQDMQEGDLVLEKGQQLQAQHIGMLASLGIQKINVFKPLKIGILTTGDELIPVGEKLNKGQIYNSNGPMLSALIQQQGYQISVYRHAPDDRKITEQTLKEMADESDFIISSGGVSVGEEDHVKSVVEGNGFLSLWKIAIKPGKPLVHGEVFSTPFLGLPGNPSSTLVTFHFFATLALGVSAGKAALEPSKFQIAAGFDRSKSIKRDEFLRVIINDNQAIPHAQQSSGALSAACVADGYLHIPSGNEIKKGKKFTFYPFSSF